MARAKTSKSASRERGRGKKDVSEEALYFGEIQEKAYDNYLDRMNGKGQSGDAMSDWLEAEKEIKLKHSML